MNEPRWESTLGGQSKMEIKNLEINWTMPMLAISVEFGTPLPDNDIQSKSTREFHKKKSTTELKLTKTVLSCLCCLQASVGCCRAYILVL
jgi:hypothetical protein